MRATLCLVCLGVGLVLLAGCRKEAKENNPREQSSARAVPTPKVVITKSPPAGPNKNLEWGEASISTIARGTDRFKDRQAIDDQYPLPQDPEKAKRLRAEETATMRKGTVEVFDKGENAKAPWADAARKAMEAYCVRYARSRAGYTGVEYQEFLAAVKEADAAKCDDPLVLYFQVRFLEHENPEAWDHPAPARTVERFRSVLARLPKTPYAPLVRIHMAWNTYTFLEHAGRKAPGTVREEELAAALKEFWKVFEELAASGDRPSLRTVNEVANLVGQHYHQTLGESRMKAWKEVDKTLEKVKAPEWLRLSIEGQNLVLFAWDARGGGFADTVTPEGWKLFYKRLEDANDRLVRSWEAEPTHPQAATAMISVAMGRSSPRAEMEKWFRRAMEADPDCLAACRAKATYLKPQWFGTYEDQLSFGYQCARTRNWYAHLPMVVDLTYFADGGLPYPVGPDAENFYKQDVIFADLRALYLMHLAEYPNDRWARTRFAAICVAAGRAHSAVEHFQALGDRPFASVFPDRAAYENYKSKAFATVPKQNSEK